MEHTLRRQINYLFLDNYLFALSVKLNNLRLRRSSEMLPMRAVCYQDTLSRDGVKFLPLEIFRSEVSLWLT